MDVSVVRAIAAERGASRSKRPTSSAAKCCRVRGASAVAAARTRPPERSAANHRPPPAASGRRAGRRQPRRRGGARASASACATKSAWAPDHQRPVLLAGGGPSPWSPGTAPRWTCVGASNSPARPPARGSPCAAGCPSQSSAVSSRRMSGWPLRTRTPKRFPHLPLEEPRAGQMRQPTARAALRRSTRTLTRRRAGTSTATQAVVHFEAGLVRQAVHRRRRPPARLNRSAGSSRSARRRQAAGRRARESSAGRAARRALRRRTRHGPVQRGDDGGCVHVIGRLACGRTRRPAVCRCLALAAK